MTDAPIVVAILTYQRPDGLRQVLHDLGEHLAGSGADASILVIDNDREPSAQSMVKGIPRVSYVHEPRPGIAAARNRAIEESSGRRLLVFIDDDERPEPGWLDALVATWEPTHPAAVVGPVISRFPEVLDPWIEAGGYFRRLRHPTGTLMSTAATNNLLLDLDVVRALGLRFDDRFGISGGSDTFFTRSLVRAGGEIVWCDEAVVIDAVPTDRMTRAWVRQRARRLGKLIEPVFGTARSPWPGAMAGSHCGRRTRESTNHRRWVPGARRTGAPPRAPPCPRAEDVRARTRAAHGCTRPGGGRVRACRTCLVAVVEHLEEAVRHACHADGRPGKVSGLYRETTSPTRTMSYPS